MKKHRNDRGITKDDIPVFDASEVSNMACEEIVDYHKYLLRMEEMVEI